MKSAWILALAVLPVWGQAAKPAVAPSALTINADLGPRIAPQSFTALEGRFDDALRRFKDPVDVLGGTRAFYFRDYGLVLTTEVSLVVTPSIMPFRPQITKEEAARIHTRKVAQIAPLKEAMKEMIKTAAMNVAPAVGPQFPESKLQVVLAVRLLYLPWEDMTSLPAQIVMKADLRHAMAGEIQVDEQ